MKSSLLRAFFMFIDKYFVLKKESNHEHLNRTYSNSFVHLRTYTTLHSTVSTVYDFVYYCLTFKDSIPEQESTEICETKMKFLV